MHRILIRPPTVGSDLGTENEWYVLLYKSYRNLSKNFMLPGKISCLNVVLKSFNIADLLRNEFARELFRQNLIQIVAMRKIFHRKFSFKIFGIFLKRNSKTESDNNALAKPVKSIFIHHHKLLSYMQTSFIIVQLQKLQNVRSLQHWSWPSFPMLLLGLRKWTSFF